MDTLDKGFLLHGRYMIIHPLAKGGMGMVYQAEDTSLKNIVAVKENYGFGEESTKQFLQEARLLAALHHPHLPRVTDYFVLGARQYLVMDFLPGDDLQNRLEKEGRQPVEKVMDWISHLVDALVYMHSQTPPITHRDIKPANIRLREDGSAVLVDFGIAKAADSEQKTGTGAKGYTPGFAPPEQAGGGRTGPYSDQFSLAATTYTLLTGNRPTESVKRVLEEAPMIDAQKLNNEIPANISAALNKAMALQPENRFADIQTFYAAMQDPDFRWSEEMQGMKSLPVVRGKPSTWLIAGFGVIGLLVIAIISVLSVAALGLLKPAQAVQQSTQPIEVQLASPPVSEKSGVHEIPDIPPTVTQTISFPVEELIEPTKAFTPQAPLASGKLLAFSSDRGDGSTLQIWLMQVGLSNAGKPVVTLVEQFTDSPGDKFYPAWSPDGETLLFSALGEEAANGLDIWRMPLKGGKAENISNFKGDDLYASWSADGKLISFTNNGRDDGVSQLFFMEPDGSNQRRISTEYEESQGIWSPDAGNLLYIIRASGNRFLYQRDAEGNFMTPQPYDVSQVFGRLGQVTDPAFSLDGKFLAYTRSKGRDKRIGVVEYLSKGANSTIITDTGKDFDPAWSPDGKWIAFTSERDGNPEIYIMSAAGLIQTNVSQSGGQDAYPAWQP